MGPVLASCQRTIEEEGAAAWEVAASSVGSAGGQSCSLGRGGGPRTVLGRSTVASSGLCHDPKLNG